MKNTIVTLILLCFTGSLLLFGSCKNKTGQDGTGGTIGQVKKYRKEQMSEKDILLRSEVMKDTSRLDEIIQGLIFFNAYTTALEMSLGNRLADMESVSEFTETYDLFFQELSDFRDFLKNNNTVLTNTITMLADFYNDTITESSADVENNLRAFVNYIRQLEEKDSVMTVAVNNLDTYIGDKEQTIIDREEVEKLKAIRDELLIRIIQGAYILNDPDAVVKVGDKKVYSWDNCNTILNTDQLQVFFGDLGVEILSTSTIESFILQGSEFIGSSGNFPAKGDPTGGSSVSPGTPPGSPNFAPDVPLVVQGLIFIDKDINGFVQMQESKTDLNALDLRAVAARDTPLFSFSDYYSQIWTNIGYVAGFVQSVESLNEAAL